MLRAWVNVLLSGLAALMLWVGCRGGGGAGSDADLAAAWQEARYLNFAKSKRLFESARDGAEPGSVQWVESSLGLAVSLQHVQPDVRGDKERAAGIYEELIAACTNRAVLAQVLLLRARLADQVDYSGDAPDRERAEALYRRLIDEFPGTRQANEAMLYLGHLAAFSHDPEAAARFIHELEGWIKAHPDNPLVSIQWELIARLYMYPLDDSGKAAAAFLKSEEVGLPPMTQRDSFFWRLACLAERAGDTDTAAHYFERIILEEPRSGYGYESQQRLTALGRTPPPLTDPFTYEPSAKGGLQ